MAAEFQRFAVTIPKGTPVTAPVTFSLAMPPRKVRKLEVIIPPGPRGEVGFQVAMAGGQLIPYTTGQFIVEDDWDREFELDGFPDSGAWQVIAYNTGTFPHTLEFIFSVDLIDQATAEAPAPISNADLSQPPVLV